MKAHTIHRRDSCLCSLLIFIVGERACGGQGGGRGAVRAWREAASLCLQQFLSVRRVVVVGPDRSNRTLAIPKELDLHEVETIKSQGAVILSVRRGKILILCHERMSNSPVPAIIFLVPFFCDLHATSSSLLYSFVPSLTSGQFYDFNLSRLREYIIFK